METKGDVEWTHCPHALGTCFNDGRIIGEEGNTCIRKDKHDGTKDDNCCDGKDQCGMYALPYTVVLLGTKVLSDKCGDGKHEAVNWKTKEVIILVGTRETGNRG